MNKLLIYVLYIYSLYTYPRIYSLSGANYSECRERERERARCVYTYVLMWDCVYECLHGVVPIYTCSAYCLNGPCLRSRASDYFSENVFVSLYVCFFVGVPHLTV